MKLYILHFEVIGEKAETINVPLLAKSFGEAAAMEDQVLKSVNVPLQSAILRKIVLEYDTVNSVTDEIMNKMKMVQEVMDI